MIEDNERIEQREDALGGEPVFKGTRIPVLHVGKMFSRGEPMASILSDFPGLTEEDVNLAALFYRTQDIRSAMAVLRVRPFYVMDDDGNAAPEPDIVKWANWKARSPSHIAFDQIGTVVVSTIFLGVDMSSPLSKEPICFETMVFDGDCVQSVECRRTRTRAEALKAHAELLAQLTGAKL